MSRVAHRITTALSLSVLAAILIVVVDLSTPIAIALDSTRQIAQYSHTVWQTENGLPQNTVRAILQTQDGYIWLATEEGLVRFDGLSFTVFDKHNVPRMRSNNIQVIYENKQGDLWVGTDDGLARLRNGSFTVYSNKDGLSNNNVGSICEAQDGSIWIGTPGGLNRFKDERIISYTTRDGLPSDSVGLIRQDRRGDLWISTPRGLARFSGDTFAVYTIADGLPSTNVVSAYESRKGELWFGTSGGLARFDDNRFIGYTNAVGLFNNMIWSIEEDNDGNLWLGTDGGLTKFAGGKFVTLTKADGLPDNTVLSVYCDRSGTLWLGTPSGLGRLAKGRLSAYTTRDGLSSNIISSVYEDREGNLWVGTEAGGLNLFKDTKFVTYTTRDGLPDDMTWTICEGRDGSMWIGSQSNGLSRFKDGKFTSYTTREGLPSNIVRALCEDKDGSLWAGTPSGLVNLRDGHVSTYTIQDGLSNNAVWAVHQDRQGSLWIGTLGGLTRLKDGKFSVYTTQDGLSDDSVLAIQSDSKGNLWVGTRSGGLNRFSDGRFTTFNTNDGLSDNSVRAIHEDSEGCIWIGTRRGGLTRFKEGKFTAITTRDGLFDDCVYQILEDNQGNLWMSSTKGVSQIKRSQLDDFADGKTSHVSPVFYGTADGMESRECNGGQPAGWRARDGRLWFPTVKGLAVIDPENIRINEIAPPLKIEQILADNQAVDQTQKVEFGAGTDRLEIHYNALSFAAPEKVRFRYKLEGYDKDWIDAGSARVAYYTSIAPGNYTFRVLGCNNDGVWNEAGASFSFYLRPHIYQTYWFYLLVVVLLAASGWSLYRLRIRRIRAEFSAVLAERSRMARDIHDTLAQGFVGIALQLDAVGKTLNETPDTARHHLDLAQDMVTHSLAEARRTVWDLRSRALERGDLASALAKVLNQMTAGTTVQSRLDVKGDVRRLDSSIEDDLLRIGQEAVTNALKHARPSHISIELRFNADNVNLVVQDDGCGFDPGEKSSARNGHFGVIGMRERTQRRNGRLDIKSRPGAGTEISVSVPVG
jgi:ligand-binding sensor domain-containing protein/signal transduction histidine kinase